MDLLKSFEPKFQRVLSSLQEELGALRVGRASPALVENIEVEIYGARTPVKGLAAIAIPDPRTIVIQPWDRGTIEAIEKAIRNAPAGLTPIVEQAFIRIQLQPLTQEKREELKKIVGHKTEAHRIRVRQLRDEVWSVIQAQEKRKEISEDAKFRLKERMEDMVKKIGERIKEVEKKKEEELMRI